MEVLAFLLYNVIVQDNMYIMNLLLRCEYINRIIVFAHNRLRLYTYQCRE